MNSNTDNWYSKNSKRVNYLITAYANQDCVQRLNIIVFIFSRPYSWYQVQDIIIARLKYLNLEVSQGKVINTKENIQLRCRIKPSEEHIWHTPHSQLNTIVDLIYNFYISWEKRQDNLDQKFESIFKEYQKLADKCSGLNSKIDIILHKLEEVKARQNIIGKNNDYIKEEVLTIGRYLSKGKDSSSHSESSQDIPEIKRLVQEVKTLILS